MHVINLAGTSISICARSLTAMVQYILIAALRWIQKLGTWRYAVRILMAGTGTGGAQNFERTVLAPVDLERHDRALTVGEQQLLARLHGRFARVWGVPIPQHRGITAVTNLQPCDQAWFHHAGLVHHVATVMAVFYNLDFDRSVWAESEFPATGFVFTVAEPQAAMITKTEINKLLGYQSGFTWQGNLLLTEEQSRQAAAAVQLRLAG